MATLEDWLLHPWPIGNVFSKLISSKGFENEFSNGFRCYITLTTALHLYRGGSPKGPAGTGKTETVKDLGKAMGMWVIVNNCSEGLDYKVSLAACKRPMVWVLRMFQSMGKCFSGLAQTGAWGCFDEFNRINIEVLSVVAQQILCILQALTLKQKRLVFEGFSFCQQTCPAFFTDFCRLWNFHQVDGGHLHYHESGLCRPYWVARQFEVDVSPHFNDGARQCHYCGKCAF